MSYERAQLRMVEEQIRARGVRDPRVLAAMSKVPRHLFVDEALRDHAYQDKALPIGEKQTISQPYMVAAMSEALELRPQDRVLEIGTGCGYQTAVLAELAETVFSIERIPAFAQRARRLLESLGYYNVLVQTGDGTIGWNEHAPFDAIVVTAGAPQAPRPLTDQLKSGGRLVLPMGDEQTQTLVRLRKTEALEKETLGECRFVKLIGRHGWEK
ncbi:MAG: protein-L-isoaspartate(D-aspartate) O-methyltransferase [Candidatus Binatota bacterium]|nr:protein-L-isoaspartate(D-aspartate) O-methyltransferase [Candidatus Binatota bacterium]